MKSIILIGYMGAGKSTIGKALAQKRQIPFLDTDIWIEERQGKKIAEIFADEGEEYFRKLETNMLKELKEKVQTHVIATGGGLPIQAENQILLKEIGVVFYLEVKKETILIRLNGDKSRPLLLGEEKEQKIERMLKIRHPIYQQFADFCISTDEKNVESVVEEIEKILENHTDFRR